MANEGELHEFGRRGLARREKRLRPVGPEEHEAVSKGKAARLVLDAAGPLYFDLRRDLLIKEAFGAIRKDGAIRPEVAVRILTQLYEHDQVLRDFQELERKGNQASERISSLDSKNQ